jgi:hypothetical protein
MKRIRHTLLTAGPLCLVLAACDDGVVAPLATAAPAPTPAFTRAPDMGTASFPFSYTEDCGSFTDIVEGTADLKFWTFYDNSGTAVTEHIHFVFKVTHTNSVTGNVLRDDGEGRAFFDLITGTITEVGTGFHTTDQGRGLILGMAGRIMVDSNGNPTFIAGPHPDGEPDWCALHTG